MVAYRDFRATFGNDELLVVMFTLDTVGLEVIEKATRAVQAVPDVFEVLSATSGHSLASDPDAAGPTTVSEVLADPLLSGRVISADGRAAVLLIRSKDGARAAVLDAVDAALADVNVPYRKAGVGVVTRALNQVTARDTARLAGVCLLVMVLLLFAVFRSVWSVGACIASVLMAEIWMLGAFGAAGRSINLVTMVMPTVAFVIGLSGCVHMLLAGSVREVLRPCMASTLTTAAAFLSLAASPMPAVRELGLFTAFGVVCQLVTAVVVCSWVLERRPVAVRGDRLARWATNLAGWAASRPRRVLVGAALIAVGGGIGIAAIDVDTVSIDLLPDDHPVRADSDAIESVFGPYVALEFTVPGTGLEPTLLKDMDRWQRAAEASSAVGWSSSIMHVVKRLEQVLSDGRPDSFRVPDDAARIEQAIYIYETSRDTTRLQDKKRGLLRVVFGIPMMSARSLEALISHVQSLTTLDVTPAGYVPLYVAKMDRIVSSQLSSIALGFVLVFVIVGLVLRSSGAALLAIPANVVPVLLMFGVMAALGVRLDAATATISAVVLGLVVDDSVHFLHRLRAHKGEPVLAAIRATAASAGRAMTVTTVVLCAGFAVLGLAEIHTITSFGLLIGLALIAALLADLLVLPALVVLTQRRR